MSRETSDGRHAENQPSAASLSNRRRFLKLTGGAVTFGAMSSIATAQDDGGPSNPDDWTVAFEDNFEAESLDDSAWSIGWGWGTEASTSDVSITEENVSLEDDRLRLQATNDDEPATGGVNTKGGVEFGPGSYVEARLRFPARVGFHPTFWAQPVSDEWPPEIDIAELTQDDSGRDDTHTSRHFLHYTVSTEPGDTSTHERVSQFHEADDNLTENFHVYGVEWQADSITYYVDGQEIQTWTDSTILESLRQGAPFYLMFILSVNIDSDLNEYLGQVDTSESWEESFDVDWVRVWEQ